MDFNCMQSFSYEVGNAVGRLRFTLSSHAGSSQGSACSARDGARVLSSVRGA